MSLQIHVKGKVTLPVLSGAEVLWCMPEVLLDGCCVLQPMWAWLYHLCQSSEASRSNLIFRPVCCQIPWASCALSLSPFICLPLCSGVTPSSPSHVNTLRQLRLLLSLLIYRAASSAMLFSHANGKAADLWCQTHAAVRYSLILWCGASCWQKEQWRFVLSHQQQVWNSWDNQK